MSASKSLAMSSTASEGADALSALLTSSLEICRQRNRADVGDHVLDALRALYGEESPDSVPEPSDP